MNTGFTFTVFLTIVSFADAVLLNFRFSPKFDVKDSASGIAPSKHSNVLRAPQRHPKLFDVESDASNKRSVSRKAAEEKLARLKAELEELKADLQFDDVGSSFSANSRV